MFYYLDGTVAEVLPYLAVIDCGGVGYACKTTNTTLSARPAYSKRYIPCPSVIVKACTSEFPGKRKLTFTLSGLLDLFVTRPVNTDCAHKLFPHR